MHEEDVRTLLFHRKYRRFHGGHLKVWDYFNHVNALPGWESKVIFDQDSTWDNSNPWTTAMDSVVAEGDNVAPSALFVAGRDWQRLDRLGLLDRGLPIVNLIQHVRHAEDWTIQSRYLGHKAIRICVSAEVGDTIQSVGCEGPIVVIPYGIDIAVGHMPAPEEKTTSLLIAGLKQPAMAMRAAEQLAAPGRSIEVLTELVPRTTFLDALRRARVTLFLPNEGEGFFLPALEGMALGTIVVCPDCVGNRTFCLPGITSFRPDYQFDEILSATVAALALPGTEANRLLINARETAARHTLEAERNTFASLLADLERLWAA